MRCENRDVILTGKHKKGVGNGGNDIYEQDRTHTRQRIILRDRARDRWEIMQLEAGRRRN
jgi:hypothetical protein